MPGKPRPARKVPLNSKDSRSGAGRGPGSGGRQAAGRTRAAAGTAAEAPGTKRRHRARQLVTVFKQSRKEDRRLLPYTAAAVLGPIAVGVLLGLFVGPWWIWIPIFVLFGAVLGLNVFMRRVQVRVFRDLEGKPGAAAGVVQNMRGEWRVHPAVQVNPRTQDMVTRVVCRAGVVVIGEGGPRVRELMITDLRKVKKIVGDTPVHEIVIGKGDGQVEIGKLQMNLMRKPRVLKPPQVDQLDKRLTALAGSGPTLPVPKGPLPRSVPRGRMR